MFDLGTTTLSQSWPGRVSPISSELPNWSLTTKCLILVLYSRDQVFVYGGLTNVYFKFWR